MCKGIKNYSGHVSGVSELGVGVTPQGLRVYHVISEKGEWYFKSRMCAKRSGNTMPVNSSGSS